MTASPVEIGISVHDIVRLASYVVAVVVHAAAGKFAIVGAVEIDVVVLARVKQGRRSDAEEILG